MIVENINAAPIVSTVLQPGRRTKVTPEMGRKLIRTGNFREVRGNAPTQDDIAISRYTSEPESAPEPAAMTAKPSKASIIQKAGKKKT